MKKKYFIVVMSILLWMPVHVFGQAVVIGNATGSNSAHDYPAPFGRYYYGSRHQFIYTAAELQSAGLLSATPFDSIGFNVTAVNGADNHARFTIRIGNVANANLASGWIDTTLLTRVYRNTAGVQPVEGWNMFKLDEPFLWDGTSDLVVETFHNDNVAYTENASTQWTATLALSITPTRYVSLDGASDNAFYTATGSTSENTRTDIRLVIAGPMLHVVPNTINFNNVQINTTSAPQTFTLRNIGIDSVFLNSIQLIGTNASEFLLSGLPTLPATLTTNTVTFNASAAPTTTGNKSASVRLTYTTSESNEDVVLDVQLVAQGVGETPEFGYTPTSINFGQFANGSTTSPRSITVKNLAGGALVINSTSIGGIDAARFGLVDTNTYPKILGINDSLRFGVTFSPIAAQSYSALVNITHSGSIIETVSLSGTGVDAFIVSNNNDAGDGSLRQVIELVNKSGGSQVIQFTTTGSINLLSSLPSITANVSIIGPGASQLTIRRDKGAGDMRIFSIASGASVSMSGLSISDGSGEEIDGAGILNEGNLTLNNCIISNNNSGFGLGGGIYNTGTVAITNSILFDNAGEEGGGIYNSGTLVTNSSTIRDNNAILRGGGIFNSEGMKLSNTTLSSNVAIFLGKRGGNSVRKRNELSVKSSRILSAIRKSQEGVDQGFGPMLEGISISGGGLYSSGANDTLINCQVIANYSDDRGGGIYVESGAMVVRNSSIQSNGAGGNGGGIYVLDELILEESNVDSNYADNNGGGVYLSSVQGLTARRSVISRNVASTSGGGVFVTGGTAALTNVTVSANVSDSGGSGVHVESGGLLNFENTIIYSNYQDTKNGVGELFGIFVMSPLRGLNSLGYNLIGTLTPGSIIGGDVSSNLTAHPQFVDSASANYRLLPTSPAVDNGNPSLVPPLGGEPFVDIGAYEVIANTVATSNPSVGTSFTVLGGGAFALRAQSGTADVSAQQFFTFAPTITQGRAIQRYWDINSDVPAFLRFYYRQSEVDEAGFTTNPVIYHFTGGTWVAVPTSAPFTLANGIRYVESTSPVNSFSPFTLGDPNDAPLPVELTNFRGTSASGKVTLTWQTISEVDNQGFMVMRDSVQIASFENYPELVGQGTSNEAKTYTFNDAFVEVGKTYTYTLRSRDFNGTVHNYPNRVSVKVEGGAGIVYEYRLAQNYPNPFNPTTRIEYGLKARGRVTIQLYDVLGRMVATLVNEVKDAGNYAVTFNASALSSGMYFYRYTAGGKTFTKQMLLIK